MMSSDIAGKLLLIVFFLLCSAYFSATETAFSSLSKTRVRAMAERGNRRAELVLSLAERYDDLLSTLFGSEALGDQSESQIIYLSNRESLMRLISVSDFYSIGIHDFELQDSGYQAVSIPIADCDFLFEFGYVYSRGTELSRITQEFLQNVEKRLNCSRDSA